MQLKVIDQKMSLLPDVNLLKSAFCKAREYLISVLVVPETA